MKRLDIIIPCVALASLAASAQNLSKEIIIDREITPELRAVTRINSYPIVFLPEVQSSRLSFSDMTTAAAVPGMISAFEPASFGASIPLSPYRGYASLGYFPVFNLGASAGYRLVNTSHTSLGIWAQYDGNSYKIPYGPLFSNHPQATDNRDFTVSRNTVTAGIDFTHIFRRAGRLDINADFTFNRLNRPWITNGNDSVYNSRQFDAEAVWSARRHDMSYFVSGAFSHFGLGNRATGIPVANDVNDSHTQNIVTFKAGTGYYIGEHSSLAGLASVDFVRYNQFNILGGSPLSVIAGEGKTLGLINLNPSFRYRSGSFSTILGLKAQLTTNTGKTFHIAPDISAAVSPSDFFTARIVLTGGQEINRLSRLFDINPYMPTPMAYGFSHIPLDAELSLSFGPFSGASVEIFGGYAMADDWLMPAWITDNDINTPEATVGFRPVDLRAVRFGAKFSWKYRDMFTFTAKYQGTPGSGDHSYYLNPDRAKHIIETALSVNPISPLTVDVSFSLRSNRSIIVDCPDTYFDLESFNMLNIGGSYRLTEAFTAFLRVENVINNRAFLPCFIEQQGVKGLAGIAVKF